MTIKNDGGPAFPVPSAGTGDPRDGMTQGLMACPCVTGLRGRRWRG